MKKYFLLCIVAQKKTTNLPKHCNYFFMETTYDFLLGGKLAIRQPQKGYRFSDDAVFLASSLRPTPGQKILDVGSGVGVVSCCVAWRCPTLETTGVEIVPHLAYLARVNHRLHGFSYRCVVGDLYVLPFLGNFDHVFSNPPFYAHHAHTPSTCPLKRQGRTLYNLKGWVNFCLRHLKANGTISLIVKTHQLSDVLSCVHQKIGFIRLLPLCSYSTKFSQRIIVQGVKGKKGGLVLHKDFVIHNPDGSHTSQAHDILWGEKTL